MADYSASVIATNPVAYWRLGDNGTTTAVDVMGVHNGTYTGGYTLGVAGLLTGDSDTAVTLNGSTGFISVNDHNSLDFGNGPFTYVAWVKRGTINTHQTIFDKGVHTPSIGLNSSNRFALYMNSIGLVVESTTTLTDTTGPHMLAVTRAADTTTLLYIDGIDRTGTVTSRTFANTATVLRIGSGVSIEFFNGTVDEASVWNTNLTPTQIESLYNAGITAPASGISALLLGGL